MVYGTLTTYVFYEKIRFSVSNNAPNALNNNKRDLFVYWFKVHTTDFQLHVCAGCVWVFVIALNLSDINILSEWVSENKAAFDQIVRQ